jgi:hypothetical protein
MSVEVIAIIVTIVIAVVGYVATYITNILLSRRTERLNIINKQLSEFYGPLYSIVDTGDRVWKAFRDKYPHVDPNTEASEPNTGALDEELEAWRLWMTTVFMPQNLQVYELITSKADLLIGSDIPQVLKEFCAHVAAYKAVVKQWEDQKFSESYSAIRYPRDELRKYSTQSFLHLKKKQEKIIGKMMRSNSPEL